MEQQSSPPADIPPKPAVQLSSEAISTIASAQRDLEEDASVFTNEASRQTSEAQNGEQDLSETSTLLEDDDVAHPALEIEEMSQDSTIAVVDANGIPTEQPSKVASREGELTPEIEIAGNEPLDNGKTVLTKPEIEGKPVKSNIPIAPVQQYVEVEEPFTTTPVRKQSSSHAATTTDQRPPRPTMISLTTGTASKTKKHAIDLVETEATVKAASKRPRLELQTKARRTRSNANSGGNVPIDLDQTESEDENATEIQHMEDNTGNSFPRFSTGDVYIHIHASQGYRLHSQVLSRVSSWYRKESKTVVSEPDDSLAKTASKSGKLKYRFEYMKNEDPSGRGCLVRSTLTKHQHSRKKQMRNIKCEHSNNSVDEIEAQAYDDLFRLLYHSPGLLQVPTDIKRAFKHARVLLAIQDDMGADCLVQSHLKSALMNFSTNHDLYRAIAANPCRWLELSLDLKSAPIFKEAVTHIVGGWNRWQRQVQDINHEHSASVNDLLLRKANSFLKQKSATERKLLQSTIDLDGRPLYFHDMQLDGPHFLTWLVAQYWQGWYVQIKANAGGLNAPMCRVMHSKQYMSFEDVSGRIERVLSRLLRVDETKHVMEDITIMKDYAAREVAPLVANYSMLAVEREGTMDLTCTEVRDDELPWLVIEVIE